jgi:hypothetical protein
MMQLLPTELRAQLPRLYAQENIPDPIVHVKFFTPDSSWTWYVTEGQEDDGEFRFVGFVVGLGKQWGISCSPSWNRYADRSVFTLRGIHISSPNHSAG